MKKFRLLSAFLTVVMVLGMLASAVPAFAAEEEELVPGLDPETGKPTIAYLTEVFDTPQAKLATMTKYLEKGNYAFYVEPVSGEFAYENKKTGQILFSNPYDVSQTASSSSVKEELLSQIIIKYTDNDSELNLLSFTEACQRGQINVKKIKNGVRVEYTMGREETRKLVPKHIKRERYEELILANIPQDSPAWKKFEAFYQLKDPFDTSLTERAQRELRATFPITEEMAIYVFDPQASDRELNMIEAWIKEYCPEYTYETLEEDHSITQYEGADRAPVLFRLSLEYTLDEDGSLDVRLPANGIRFDESTYQLTYISLLPFFGAGAAEYRGYTFIPDGSGALIRFEDVSTKPVTLTGKLYGQDYAYQVVSGEHKEVMRLPVYGVVETNDLVEPVEEAAPVVGTEGTDSEAAADVYVKPTNGFIAILEEGDSLAEISSVHGGTLHKYNTVYTTFYPRPKDSYNLAESISVGQNATYTVVSERKYTGSYRIKYIMLTEEELAKDSGLKDYYEASYVGMAAAYRDYLKNEGKLTDLTDVKDSIPLYIETFGALNTIERILSIPVEVLKPLTTFDDLKNMYSTLSEAGITNVNYKLTGYANGGMNDIVPYKVKFEKEIGGNKGFTEFVAYAEQNGIGVYPDFDFVNVGATEMFDGITYRKHLVKTMDNRYTSKRYYDSTLQEFVRGWSLAISPSVFDYFYEHFNEEMQKLSPSGLSVSTLGTDLNSDFDKKDPYNREDSREFTTDLLAQINEDYKSVMVDGGNAYVYPYVDHMINVALDSSRFSNASEAVPFMGMVLHGSLNFAGTPINMAGDTKYELLKAIENGASMYFVLSCQNTSLLKEDIEFNKYYSVSFDIWKEDVIEFYNTLNDAIGDLQDKKIIDHKFLMGERVPSADEIAADKEAADAIAEAKAEAEKIAKEKEEKRKKLEERLAERDGREVEEIPSVEVPVLEEKPKVSPDGYVYTKYTSDDGRIVKVTYEGGKSFILNYNSFEITVEDNGKTYTIGALDFVKVK